MKAVQVCGQTLTPKVAGYFQKLAKKNPAKSIEVLDPSEDKLPGGVHKSVEQQLKLLLFGKGWVSDIPFLLLSQRITAAYVQ